MSFETGTATNYRDLLTKLRTFVEATLPIAERYTVMRFTDDGTNMEVIWKAPGLGSTSFAITSITRTGTVATVTTTAVHGLTTGQIIIIAGATDALYNGTYVITVVTTTTFTYTMTGTPAISPATGTITVVLPAFEIYFGIRTYRDVGLDVYNWKINTFTGFITSNTFDTQPGRVSYNIGIPMWNTSIPYIFVANGQRVILRANIQNNYQTSYLGKFLPYASPSQWPYPIISAGMLTTDALTRYDNTTYTAWFKGARNNFAMRFTDGSYRTPQMFPFQGANTLRNTKSVSTNDEITEPGFWGLHSLVISENTGGFVNNYGELDGIYFISGFSNAVENTIVISGVTYEVIRDVVKTGLKDFIALRLQ
jgi:hypothetical protein